MYNITDLLPGNKISGKFSIILRNYSHCAPSQLSVYLFIYLFIYLLLRFLTISRKSALGLPCPN